MGINISHKLVLISHVKLVVIWVLRRIKILIVILDEFVDLIEVVQIKMVALDTKVPFDRFSKELRFVGVGLSNFVSMLQSRIIALTLRLKKVFDFMPRLVGVSLLANGVAEFFPTSLRFYPKFILNLFLQLIDTRFYSRVFHLGVLSAKLTFLLN